MPKYNLSIVVLLDDAKKFANGLVQMRDNIKLTSKGHNSKTLVTADFSRGELGRKLVSHILDAAGSGQ
tara:strand:- start:941 stop:1144 length:204 start_codon:yes stop_codon:yes gene_type:complete